ncbi:hypothetical protein DFP72DRAFT_1068375 [Ephemerocybe angulata]|uniref:Uncharacterized protein n=1 Tax=Ephemerocybe angulata TaxID=980116 RepID=A0A8H6HXN0_9AGAR|nr:hypothetical protein DFP72DRAFT_1068375 [Tulosesus angulatus]
MADSRTFSQWQAVFQKWYDSRENSEKVEGADIVLPTEMGRTENAKPSQALPHLAPLSPLRDSKKGRVDSPQKKKSVRGTELTQGPASNSRTSRPTPYSPTRNHPGHSRKGSEKRRAYFTISDTMQTSTPSNLSHVAVQPAGYDHSWGHWSEGLDGFIPPPDNAWSESDILLSPCLDLESWKICQRLLDEWPVPLDRIPSKKQSRGGAHRRGISAGRSSNGYAGAVQSRSTPAPKPQPETSTVNGARQTPLTSAVQTVLSHHSGRSSREAIVSVKAETSGNLNFMPDYFASAPHSNLPNSAHHTPRLNNATQFLRNGYHSNNGAYRLPDPAWNLNPGLRNAQSVFPRHGGVVQSGVLPQGFLSLQELKAGPSRSDPAQYIPKIASTANTNGGRKRARIPNEDPSQDEASTKRPRTQPVHASDSRPGREIGIRRPQAAKPSSRSQQVTHLMLPSLGAEQVGTAMDPSRIEPQDPPDEFLRGKLEICLKESDYDPGAKYLVDEVEEIIKKSAYLCPIPRKDGSQCTFAVIPSKVSPSVVEHLRSVEHKIKEVLIPPSMDSNKLALCPYTCDFRLKPMLPKDLEDHLRDTELHLKHRGSRNMAVVCTLCGAWLRGHSVKDLRPKGSLRRSDSHKPDCPGRSKKVSFTYKLVKQTQ